MQSYFQLILWSFPLQQLSLSAKVCQISLTNILIKKRKTPVSSSFELCSNILAQVPMAGMSLFWGFGSNFQLNGLHLHPAWSSRVLSAYKSCDGLEQGI